MKSILVSLIILFPLVGITLIRSIFYIGSVNNNFFNIGIELNYKERLF